MSKKHEEESKLFAKLCQDHYYAFADTLPLAKRTVMMRDADGVVSPHYVVALKVPGDSSLGTEIAKMRKGGKK